MDPKIIDCAVVTLPGDPAAGIPDTAFYCDMHFDPDDYESEEIAAGVREEFTRALAGAYDTLLGGLVQVRLFSMDEPQSRADAEKREEKR